MPDSFSLDNISQESRKARILVIEDDSDARSLLIDTLAEEGYEVCSASDGMDGLQMIDSAQPDLVLLDIMMPSMDGLEVCRRIRSGEGTRSLPVLILTAKDSLSEKIKGFRSGADDYITKPFVISELLARIQAHIRVQKLQRELALSEERYRLLIENSPNAILMISMNLEVLFHNSRFRELVKERYSETITGKTLEFLIPYSEIFAEIKFLLETVRSNTTPAFREVQITSSNHRTCVLEVRCMPVTLKDSCVEMFQIVINDVTQRKRMEEALIQAEKINSLGILTAGITHEVNNPLTGISSAVQIIKKGGLSRKKQEELSDLILNHIGRIVKIIKDLHIFSRPHGVTLEVFDIGNAIGETIALLKYQTKQKLITIEFIIRDGELCIYGDKNQFQQVMINLLLNSIQAIDKKGSIVVVMERRQDKAAIVIEDTGCGIPSDKLGQIFDPFFTTKRDWKGTGLGLAVSYRIIQLFKGMLNVESTPGKGSRFTITVPLHPRPR